MYEIGSLSELDREHFGPILHVVRWKSGELDKVIEAINSTGYGLTLGLQSRIDTTRQYVEANARVGNLYVNRNQIGAVVESQPFGGEGCPAPGPRPAARIMSPASRPSGSPASTRPRRAAMRRLMAAIEG